MQFLIEDQPIQVNVPNWAVLEARIRERLAQRRGFALATINVDHIVKLREQPSFRVAYAQQDFVVADGHPIVWLSHLAGRPVSLLPGSELILPMSRIAAAQGVPVALLGSTAPVLEAARQYMEREVRDLRVVKCIAPPMGFDPRGPEAETMLREIAGSGARLCFVALGAPRQEILCAFGRKLVPEIGFASIGAGLDFFAGAQQRAPVWVRQFAMEWLWRMMANPRRLGLRYLKCLAVLPGQFLRAAVLRLAGRRSV